MIPNSGGVLHSVLVQSGGAARRVRHAQGSHLVLVWRPGVLYRRRDAASISANLAMDVICENAAAAVAARVEGAYPREVWLAVIQKVFDCGFKANEQLEGITSEQVLVVVQAMSDSGIPVGHLFVRKVINAYIDRRRVPFGPVLARARCVVPVATALADT